MVLVDMTTRCWFCFTTVFGKSYIILIITAESPSILTGLEIGLASIELEISIKLVVSGYPFLQEEGEWICNIFGDSMIVHLFLLCNRAICVKVLNDIVVMSVHNCFDVSIEGCFTSRVTTICFSLGINLFLCFIVLWIFFIGLKFYIKSLEF